MCVVVHVILVISVALGSIDTIHVGAWNIQVNDANLILYQY